MYALKYKVSWELSLSERENVSFFEGILTIADKAVKLTQHEVFSMGSLSEMVKLEVVSKLQSSSISIVVLESVTYSPRMPRVKVVVGELSSGSSEFSKRTRLEAEKRYFGKRGK